MRVGVTGHSNLTPDSVPPVVDALRSTLAGGPPPLVGVTCLARGADQLFAQVVLELGGAVEVILPAADYRSRMVEPDDREQFERLVARASALRVLPIEVADGHAYAAANAELLVAADLLVAVWDGGPGERGGTGDAVRMARARGVPVTVLWPAGTTRS